MCIESAVAMATKQLVFRRRHWRCRDGEQPCTGGNTGPFQAPPCSANARVHSLHSVSIEKQRARTRKRRMLVCRSSQEQAEVVFLSSLPWLMEHCCNPICFWVNCLWPHPYQQGLRGYSFRLCLAWCSACVCVRRGFRRSTTVRVKRRVAVVY